MKIIFVGLHNKPGKMPLDSSTKSGVLIDRIIESLSDFKCIKTNLYNLEYVPKGEEKGKEIYRWFYRVQPEKNDIIILLGKQVQLDFLNEGTYSLIKMPHPASVRSHVKMDSYINICINKIAMIYVP